MIDQDELKEKRTALYTDLGKLEDEIQSIGRLASEGKADKIDTNDALSTLEEILVKVDEFADAARELFDEARVTEETEDLLDMIGRESDALSRARRRVDLRVTARELDHALELAREYVKLPRH